MSDEDSDEFGGGRPWIGEMLLPVTGAARHARDVLTQACVQWQVPHLIAPASLVASELVTNAVVHAHTMTDLRVVRGRRHLLILVCDGDSALPVTHPLAALHDRATRGRGLLLVDATADRWGCRPVPGGKMVWAALRLCVTDSAAPEPSAIRSPPGRTTGRPR